jgi:hypothetical protein
MDSLGRYRKNSFQAEEMAGAQPQSCEGMAPGRRGRGGGAKNGERQEIVVVKKSGARS